MSNRLVFLAWVVGAAAAVFAPSATAQPTRAGVWTLALGVGGGVPFRGNEGDSNPLAVGLDLRAGRTFAGAARFYLGLAAQYHPRAEGNFSKWLQPDAFGVAVDFGGGIPVWRLTVRPYVGLGALFGEVRHAPSPAPPPGTPRYASDAESGAPVAFTLHPGVSVFWRHGVLLLGADVRGVVTVAGAPVVGVVLFTAWAGLALD
jgi:hypothetical protein